MVASVAESGPTAAQTIAWRYSVRDTAMAETLESLRVVLADRYTLERELGRVGMAAVYLARDLKHDRKSAVKVLRSVRVALKYAVLGLAPQFLGAQTLDLPPLEPFGRHLRTTIQLEGEPDWLAPYGKGVWALTITGMVWVDPAERGRLLHVPVRKPCGAPVTAYGALVGKLCR
jgi:hypothetical protein